MSLVTKKYLSNIVFVMASLLAFLGMANIFSLQGYLILASSILLFLYYLINGFKKPSLFFWLLLAFGAFYNLFSFINNVWSFRQIVYFIIFPCSIYFLVAYEAQNNYKKPKIYFLCFAFGMFISAIITILATFRFYGFSLSRSQPILNSLLNYEIIARTGLSLYLMPLSVLAFAYVIDCKFNNRSLIKCTIFLLSFIVIIFSIVCSNNIGNRAYIVAFLIAVIIISFFKVILINNEFLKYATLSIILLLVIFILCLLFGFVPDFLSSIPVFSRFSSGGSNSARITLYKEFFTCFLLHPFGGTYHYITDIYVHNFWLDIYNFTGIIPFGLFTFLFVRSLYYYGKQYFGNNNLSKEQKLFFYGMISMFAIGLFEPIFQANCFTYFFFIVFIVSAPNTTVISKKMIDISI